MRKITISFLFCLMICLVLILAGCSADLSEEPREITETAVYEQTDATIGDAEFYDIDDVSMVRIHFTYTNKGSDGMYMLESFVVRVFQEDKELADLTDINDDPDSAKLIVEVKDGETIECSYVFQLASDSDIEVRVCTPTADEELLAKKIFQVSGK